MNSMKNNYIEEISKTPTSIKAQFLILHIMFGQDFGFGNLFRKKTADILKYYSAILTVTTFIILAWCFNVGYDDVWYWCTLIECIMNFCILKTSKYTMYNFVSEVHAAARIDVLEKDTFSIITSLYTLIMFIVKILIFESFCIYDFNLSCKLNRFYITLYSACCQATDLMPEVQFVIRFYIYAYVKNMESALKQDQDMNKLIERYDKIVDCQDKIRRLCDYFVLIEFFTNVPKFMATTWYVLRFIKQEHNWIVTMGEGVITLHLATQIAIPAVIVQLTKCKLDDIRQLLNKWSLAEKDPEKKAEIIGVMNYLNIGRLQYKIWGVIPIDLRLPLTLISISTTYLIVIIQLTHLYD